MQVSRLPYSCQSGAGGLLLQQIPFCPAMLLQGSASQHKWYRWRESHPLNLGPRPSDQLMTHICMKLGAGSDLIRNFNGMNVACCVTLTCNKVVGMDGLAPPTRDSSGHRSTLELHSRMDGWNRTSVIGFGDRGTTNIPRP
jgi:hypothetical protein